MLPARLANKSSAACDALDQAIGATKVKPRKRLLKKAANRWRKAGKVLKKRAISAALQPECVSALGAAFDTAATRAVRATTAP